MATPVQRARPARARAGTSARTAGRRPPRARILFFSSGSPYKSSVGRLYAGGRLARRSAAAWKRREIALRARENGGETANAVGDCRFRIRGEAENQAGSGRQIAVP